MKKFQPTEKMQSAQIRISPLPQSSFGKGKQTSPKKGEKRHNSQRIYVRDSKSRKQFLRAENEGRF